MAVALLTPLLEFHERSTAAVPDLDELALGALYVVGLALICRRSIEVLLRVVALLRNTSKVFAFRSDEYVRALLLVVAEKPPPKAPLSVLCDLRI